MFSTVFKSSVLALGLIFIATGTFAQQGPKAEALRCYSGPVDPLFMLGRNDGGGATLVAALNTYSEAMPIFSGRVYDNHLEQLVKRANMYKKIGNSIEFTFDECVVENRGGYVHCYTKGPIQLGDLAVQRFSFYYQKKVVLTMGDQFVQYAVGIEFEKDNHVYDLPFDYNGEDCKSSIKTNTAPQEGAAKPKGREA